MSKNNTLTHGKLWCQTKRSNTQITAEIMQTYAVTRSNGCSFSPYNTIRNALHKLEWSDKKVERPKNMGEAILRACEPEPRAASHEPRASVCEPQKNPAKKSKNGHNALIWHLLHAGYFIYANTRGTFYQTAPTKGNRTLTILIPFPNSSHKRSRAVNRFVKNRKANFGSPIKGNPKYSGEKKPK